MPLGLDLRTLRVAWTILVVVAGLALLYGIRHLLVLIALSVFVAYLLHPLVWRLERHLPTRHRRVLAVLLTYALIVAAIAVSTLTLGPRLSEEVGGLAARVPRMAEEIQTGALLQGVLTRLGLSPSTIDAVDHTIRAHAGEWVGALQRFVMATLGWLASVWGVVLVPILAFVVLTSGDTVTAAARFLDERRQRHVWNRIVWDLHEALGQYVRALTLLSLATLVAWTVVLALARVPYALVLATLAALLEFVPLVGPLVAGVIAVVIALMSGYPHPLLIAGFVLAWRLIQDYVTSPLVMGRGIEMPPGLVIFAVIAGGELAGPLGMFLAVPVVAATRIIWRDAREAAPAPAAPTAVRRAR